MTTGKWCEPGVPHRGWRCVNIEDNEEQDFLCEMCEAMHIRYIHTMEHDEHKPLRVGSICAGNMEQDLVRAREREADFKKRQARRKNWLTRSWRVSAAGNDFINVDGFNITVYPVKDYWGGRVLERSSGRFRISKLRYETEETAKLAAFNAMINMRTARAA
jgi:hypothetical protein